MSVMAETMSNNELWEKYHRLAFHGMNKHYGVVRTQRLGLDKEQVAWEIIQHAAKKHDPAYGDLAKYIASWTRATSNFVDNLHMSKKHQNVPACVGYDIEGFAQEKSYDKQDVIDMLSCLNGIEATIVWRHVVGRDTFADISNDVGLCEERVRVIFLNGIHSLRLRELSKSEMLRLETRKHKHKYKHR